MARPKSGAQLEAKLQEAKRIEAEIRQLKKAARDKKLAEHDQRAKVLGRIVLAHMAEQPESELTVSVNRLLAAKLSRPGERSLFPDLAPNARPPGNTSEVAVT